MSVCSSSSSAQKTEATRPTRSPAHLALRQLRATVTQGHRLQRLQRLGGYSTAIGRARARSLALVTGAILTRGGSPEEDSASRIISLARACSSAEKSHGTSSSTTYGSEETRAECRDEGRRTRSGETRPALGTTGGRDGRDRRALRSAQRARWGITATAARAGAASRESVGVLHGRRWPARPAPVASGRP